MAQADDGEVDMGGFDVRTLFENVGRRLVEPAEPLGLVASVRFRCRRTARDWIEPKRDPVLLSLVKRNARLSTLRSLYDSAAEGPAAAGAPAAASSSPATESSRNYKLAVTDLFVETALDLLERKAKVYQRRGMTAYLSGVVLSLGGVAIALLQLDLFPRLLPTGWVNPAPATLSWIELSSRFARAFTFYGFIVLSAVTLWRFGRAKLDQAERLHDRRHALRQGRLFVHLRDGEVSIDELERAFAWNLAQMNAFAHVLTDAKAPWGAVMGEVLKVIPEVVKATGAVAKDDKRPAP